MKERNQGIGGVAGCREEEGKVLAEECIPGRKTATKSWGFCSHSKKTENSI